MFINSVLPVSEPQLAECVSVLLLWVEGSVKAGFPSPAQDFECRPVDLANVLIRHPQATFMVRASGVSMLGAGINNGDSLLVDRAITPQHGQIVCASKLITYSPTAGDGEHVGLSGCAPDGAHCKSSKISASKKNQDEAVES